jgi:hypothetical protein
MFFTMFAYSSNAYSPITSSYLGYEDPHLRAIAQQRAPSRKTFSCTPNAFAFNSYLSDYDEDKDDQDYMTPYEKAYSERRRKKQMMLERERVAEETTWL